MLLIIYSYRTWTAHPASCLSRLKRDGHVRLAAIAPKMASVPFFTVSLRSIKKTQALLHKETKTAYTFIPLMLSKMYVKWIWCLSDLHEEESCDFLNTSSISGRNGHDVRFSRNFGMDAKLRRFRTMGKLILEVFRKCTFCILKSDEYYIHETHFLCNA